MLAYALSLLAGAVLPFAFAPFEQFWIAPLSYAVLFYSWRGATPRQAFWSGLVYGCGSFCAGTYWTYIAIHDFGGAPIVLAVAVSFALAFAMSLFVAAAGWTAARWFRTSGALAWLGTLPALWVLAEWLRGWLLTGFGWLSAGYSQTDSWLMGYAPVLGLHGMSWAVLVTAGALVTLCVAAVDAWRGRPDGSGSATGAGAVRRNRAAVSGNAAGAVGAAIVLAAVWGGGLAFGTQRWTTPKDETLSVALVQGAITQDLKWRPDLLPGTLALYSGLTQESRGTDLIVWPEAAIPDLYENNIRFLDGMQEWAQQSGSAVLLGILRLPPEHASKTATFQNVLVALTDPRATYVKRHLVPFGEYYPVPGFVRNWLRLLDLPYTDGVPGASDQPALDVAGERVAVTICYEDLFGAEQLHYLPDATLLVNVSNDAWFGDSIAPHQHRQIAQVRAAEAGRWLLRATNTGVTAVIDPQGRVAASVPQFEAGVLKYTVQGFTGSTPYARWGNWLVVCAALLSQLPVIAKLARRPRA